MNYCGRTNYGRVDDCKVIYLWKLFENDECGGRPDESVYLEVEVLCGAINKKIISESYLI